MCRGWSAGFEIGCFNAVIPDRGLNEGVTMAETYLKELYERKGPARPWGKFTLRPNAFSTSYYDDIARLLQGRGGRLLEVGCSRGELLAALVSQFDELVGFDLSENKVELGMREIRTNMGEDAEKIKLEAGDAEGDYPFEDGSFDVVIACAVLEHVVDVFGMMGEIARVCRPGGCVLVTVPNIAYIKRVAQLAAGQLPTTGGPVRDMAAARREGWDGSHLHYFTKDSLAKLLRSVGFEPEAWTGNGRWAKLRRWNMNLMVGMTVRARRVEL